MAGEIGGTAYCARVEDAPGVQRLAAAVIARAVDDARSMADARAFMAGPGLDWWCDAAGLDPEYVRVQYKQLMNHGSVV